MHSTMDKPAHIIHRGEKAFGEEPPGFITPRVLHIQTIAIPALLNQNSYQTRDLAKKINIKYSHQLHQPNTSTNMAFIQQLSRTTGFVPVQNARMHTTRFTARPARFVVRAEGPQEGLKELKGKIEDTLDNKVGPAARDAVTTTTQRSVEETRPENQPDTFGKILSFSGPGPERINSRLAMIGITAALASELRTHVGLLEQIKKAPGPIALTFLVFIVATIVPYLRGVSPEDTDRWSRPLKGLFTEKAEIYNGRLAMSAFASLIIIEAILGRPSLG